MRSLDWSGRQSQAGKCALDERHTRRLLPGAHGTTLARHPILNSSVIKFRTRIASMLRKLSLAIAVSCASNGVV
ncbi:hypothetical protein, partial [Escherichia coli]|uniref:hypothetical protein n=1 Tax=Escherichia coli TaxID=562 RepID=UPI002091F789